MALNFPQIASSLTSKERARLIILSQHAHREGKPFPFSDADLTTLLADRDSVFDVDCLYYTDLYSLAEMIWKEEIGKTWGLVMLAMQNLGVLSVLEEETLRLFKPLTILDSQESKDVLEMHLKELFVYRDAVRMLEEFGCGAPVFDASTTEMMKTWFKAAEDLVTFYNHWTDHLQLKKLPKLVLPIPAIQEVEVLVQKMIDFAVLLSGSKPHRESTKKHFEEARAKIRQELSQG